MTRLVGVIPAAGRGTRAYPYTRSVPKCMLEVDGEPLLARTLAIFRERMGIRDVVVIVGDQGDSIRNRFGDGSGEGVRILYVRNEAVERGLSYSILLARPHVGEHFCVILSDEWYGASNHGELLTTPYQDCLAVCAVQQTREPERISRNYTVEISGDRITKIVEKPRVPANDLLGLGTFLFHRRIFGHLEEALAGPGRGANDPVSVLGRACAAGERILAFSLTGDYVNVNDRDELNLANNLARSREFEHRTLGLAVMHREASAEALRAVEDFRKSGRFEHIVLVLPPGGHSAQVPAGVVPVIAPSDRYGDMMRAGLEASRGDILFTVSGDGAFSPRDVPKFLEYLKEADVVTGTRTTRQLIQQGSNMRGIVRLAHVILAKFLELIWWGYEPRLTDVGCTYRAIWASTYHLIRPRLSTSGPEYSVEMFLEALRCRKRVIEIPVNFQIRRKGLKERDQTLGTFAAMVRTIVQRRWISGPVRAAPDTAGSPSRAGES
jgi:NDP-sugar pyrophosphorylase family protein